MPKNDKLQVQKCGNCRAYPKGVDKTCQGAFRAESDWCDKWADKTPEICLNCVSLHSEQLVVNEYEHNGINFARGYRQIKICRNPESPENATIKIGGETCKHYERYAGADGDDSESMGAIE
ncbi:MAG: hypothetical protein GY774_04415 [Planctomycetes bacterium]|nr:hypothetical protein [Planctomycetota bacterium]